MGVSRLLRGHTDQRGIAIARSTARRLRVLNATRDHALASDVQEATNPWARMVGLLGRAYLGPGEGLYLRSCGAIHTWFMRFAIDVLYLDRNGRVVKAVPALGPFQFSSGGRHARSTLELPAGTIALTETQAGDELLFDDVHDIDNSN